MLNRYLLVPCLSLCLCTAHAQPFFSFQGLDLDANGELSRGEFTSLPGFYGDPELFANLDSDRSHSISEPEWLAGVPGENGLPQGSKRLGRAGAASKRPAFVPHGPNVPPRARVVGAVGAPPDFAFDNRPPRPTQGGAGTKRGETPTPPEQPPADLPTRPGDAAH